jgi:hypothetical protein
MLRQRDIPDGEILDLLSLAKRPCVCCVAVHILADFLVDGSGEAIDPSLDLS